MSAQAVQPMRIRPTGTLALTTRGRRVLAVAALALMLTVGMFGGRAVAGSPARAIVVDTYTVSSGESLWAIATAYTAPHADVRDTVATLVALNGLADGGLRAGQQILVPAG